MKDFTVEQLNKFYVAVVVDHAKLSELPHGDFVLTSATGSIIGEGTFHTGLELATHLLYRATGETNVPLLTKHTSLALGQISVVMLRTEENLPRVIHVRLPWAINKATEILILEALDKVWRPDSLAFNGNESPMVQSRSLKILLPEGDKHGIDFFRTVVTQILVMHYVELERNNVPGDHDDDLPVGVQPEGNWPRDEGANVNHPAMRRFLTDDNHPLGIPPRPGSPEMIRQMSIYRAMQGAGADIDTAIEHLSERVEQLDGTQDLSNDPGIIALAVLSKTRAAERRRVVQRRINLGVVFCSLVAIIALTIYFGRMMVTSGRNTIISECTVPYGDDRLTAERFQSYSYKELFGFQQIDKTSITEVTKLKLTGDDIIILGIDPKNNKPWRMDFTKGEFGNPILKPTGLYWFVGGRGKASPIAYKAFCH